MINLITYLSILLIVMAGVLGTPANISTEHFKQRGGITFYYGKQFEGSNLKCPGYRYERDTGPWLAVDIGEYESGRTRCGDWYLIRFYDGSRHFARALDSGYLADYNVWDTGLPFVADLPYYFRKAQHKIKH